MDAVIVAPKQTVLETADMLRPRLVQTQTITRPAEANPAPQPDRVIPSLAAASAEPAQPQTVAAAPTVPSVELRPDPQPAAEASEPAQSSPPAEMTLKDFLTRPIPRPKSEPASTPKEAATTLTTGSVPTPAIADGKTNASTNARANAGWPLSGSAAQPPSWFAITNVESNVVPIPVARPNIESTPPAAVAALGSEAIPIPAAKPELAPEPQDKHAKPADSRKHRHGRTRGARTVRDPERVTTAQQLVTPERTPRRGAPQVDPAPDRHRP
jgi:hypothetical protein